MLLLHVNTKNQALPCQCSLSQQWWMQLAAATQQQACGARVCCRKTNNLGMADYMNFLNDAAPRPSWVHNCMLMHPYCCTCCDRYTPTVGVSLLRYMLLSCAGCLPVLLHATGRLLHCAAIGVHALLPLVETVYTCIQECRSVLLSPCTQRHHAWLPSVKAEHS